MDDKLTLSIRFATETDISALHQLLVDTGLAVDGLDYTHWTEPVLVAAHGEHVVGFLQAVIGCPYTILTDMAVAPEYQHQGVGRLLLARMETVLRGIGIPAWVTCIGDKRPGAQAALKQWGAEPTGAGTAYVRFISRTS